MTQSLTPDRVLTNGNSLRPTLDRPFEYAELDAAMHHRVEAELKLRDLQKRTSSEFQASAKRMMKERVKGNYDDENRHNSFASELKRKAMAEYAAIAYGEGVGPHDRQRYVES